ncbi:MAG: M67 family metallopeptidase [Flavobacteriales bacterium]|nr:M67 family metallopeptidase [Flavobacteriales bacterium]
MIEIPKKYEERIVAHGEREYPYECVGFMYGLRENGTVRVREVLEIDNHATENKRRRFQVLPMDYLKAERYAEEHELELIGVYHSHPDHPARPSEHDRVQAMPVFSYVIVSIKEGKGADITSWRLDDTHEFQAEELQIENE